MKKESMIKVLRYKAEHIKTKIKPKFFVEVADMLEQQPCYNPDEWCHDCSEYDQDKHCCLRFNRVIRNTVEEIKESKVGHWIVDKGGSYLGMRNGHCSNCEDYYTNDWNVMHYCPNCGAKMIEPQAESEDKE